MDENKVELKEVSKEHYNKMHTLGRVTSLIIIILLTAVPFLIKFIYGIEIEIGKTVKAVIAVVSIYGVVAAIEFFAFAPLLGSGQYLAMITGNVTNLKLPAAMSAMTIAETEPGSPEGELVSVIAIAVSALVCSFLTFLGMILFTRLEPVLNHPALAPAFNNLMPALLGALAVPLIRDNFRVATLPVILMAIITLILGYETVAGLQTILLPLFLVISVGWAFFIFKRDEKKAKEN